MIRSVYQALLWMHPPAFRRQFAGEMLWIYDEASAADGMLSLFVDGLLSLLRQWLLRSGFWKAAAALVGGLLQITLGGLGMWVVGHAQMESYLASAPYRGEWRGTIRAGSSDEPLRLVLANDSGEWQGAIWRRDIESGPAESLKIASGEIRFSSGSAGGTLNFRGALSTSNTLRGKFQEIVNGRIVREGLWELSQAAKGEAPNPVMSALIRYTAWLVTGLLLVIMLLMLWVKKTSAERLSRLRGGRKCSNFGV